MCLVPILLFLTALGEISCETISGSVGKAASLSFPLGKCLPLDTLTIAKKGPGNRLEDIFACYKNRPKYSRGNVKGQCPKNGQPCTVQLTSVEPSDFGEYCLEINKTRCSCKHLVQKNESSVDSPTKAPPASHVFAPGMKNDSSVDTTHTFPGNSLVLWVVVAGVCVGLIVFGGIVFWKRKQRSQLLQAHVQCPREQTAEEMMEMNSRPLEQNHLRESSVHVPMMEEEDQV